MSYSEKKRQYDRKYQAEHRDVVLVYKAEYREKNKERIAEYMRNWRKNNSAKRNQHNSKYVALKNGSKVESVNYEKILERDGMICHICELEIENDLQFDHVIPLSRGGAHSMENIKPSHARCNLRKGAKLEYRSLKDR